MSPTTSQTGSVTCCSTGSTEPAPQASALAYQHAADRPVRTQAPTMPLRVMNASRHERMFCAEHFRCRNVTRFSYAPDCGILPSGEAVEDYA